MGCDECGNPKKKKSWLYYFCCGPNEEEAYENEVRQLPIQRRSKAYVPGDMTPDHHYQQHQQHQHQQQHQQHHQHQHHHEWASQPSYQPGLGGVTRFEVVGNEYPARPDYHPQETHHHSTFSHPKTNHSQTGFSHSSHCQASYPEASYSGSKVFVNSARNYTPGHTSTASSTGAINYPTAQNPSTGESRIRLNAPQGGFSGGYIDAGQSSNVIRFG